MLVAKLHVLKEVGRFGGERMGAYRNLEANEVCYNRCYGNV